MTRRSARGDAPSVSRRGRSCLPRWRSLARASGAWLHVASIWPQGEQRRMRYDVARDPTSTRAQWRVPCKDVCATPAAPLCRVRLYAVPTPASSCAVCAWPFRLPCVGPGGWKSCPTSRARLIFFLSIPAWARAAGCRLPLRARGRVPPRSPAVRRSPLCVNSARVRTRAATPETAGRAVGGGGAPHRPSGRRCLLCVCDECRLSRVCACVSFSLCVCRVRARPETRRARVCITGETLRQASRIRRALRID
jgi:hypothetical protein